MVSTDDGYFIPLCLLIPSHISYIGLFKYFYNYYLLGAHESVEVHTSVKFMKKMNEIPVLFIGFVGFLGCNGALYHFTRFYDKTKVNLSL